MSFAFSKSNKPTSGSAVTDLVQSLSRLAVVVILVIGLTSMSYADGRLSNAIYTTAMTVELSLLVAGVFWTVLRWKKRGEFLAIQSPRDVIAHKLTSQKQTRTFLMFLAILITGALGVLYLALRNDAKWGKSYPLIILVVLVRFTLSFHRNQREIRSLETHLASESQGASQA